MPGFGEFVALVAALMALTALGIDSMLPALPAIADGLGVVSPNARQWIISAFLFGFGGGQLLHGPLADRYGRKPVLITAMVASAAFNVVAALSGSFALLIAARVLGGVAVASSRVVTVALVRDLYSGRAMARVMSLAFIVFMAAPVVAPLVGQGVLLVGSWRAIFGFLALVTSLVCAWFWWRMPETLAVEEQQPLNLGRIARGYRQTLSDRASLGYTLAMGVLLGGLYGFINSVQQILADVFGVAHLLAPLFACIAASMALSSWLNSRIVMRFGTRLISHSALLGLIVIAGVHLAITIAGWETLTSFIVLQALMMACFGLATSNFGAMAMENMGSIAGTASSIQGFISGMGGALLGAAIGQSFDGSTVPLYAGFVVAGLVALGCVLVVERGRLFRDEGA